MKELDDILYYIKRNELDSIINSEKFNNSPYLNKKINQLCSLLLTKKIKLSKQDYQVLENLYDKNRFMSPELLFFTMCQLLPINFALAGGLWFTDGWNSFHPTASFIESAGVFFTAAFLSFLCSFISLNIPFFFISLFKQNNKEKKEQQLLEKYLQKDYKKKILSVKEELFDMVEEKNTIERNKLSIILNNYYDQLDTSDVFPNQDIKEADFIRNLFYNNYQYTLESKKIYTDQYILK